MHVLPFGAGIVAALALSGCNLAPDYRRPALPVPAALPDTGAPASSETGEIARIGWQSFFIDERLRAVIEQALTNNRDLRIAIANVEQARALYSIERADLFPNVGGVAGGNLQRLSRPQAAQSGVKRSQESWSVDLGSSWEIDLFGRIRNLSKAALEQFLAARETQMAVRISLVGETATAWLTLAADRERLAIAERTQEAFSRTLYLTRARFERGMASALDVRQAQTSHDQARSDIAALKTLVQQDRNALNLLVGASVDDHLLPQALDQKPATLAVLPDGMDSRILLERPDVKAAEHQLIAANADIGAARAAFFPTISLTGALGTVSGGLSGLFDNGNGNWSFQPAVSLPLFNGGRNRANLRFSEASRDAAVAQYEKTIQVAFREIADGLARRATIGEQVDAQQSLTAAATDAYRLSEARYERGTDGFLATLDAQRTLFAAQQTLVSARLTQETNLVSLYRASGGGQLE